MDIINSLKIDLSALNTIFHKRPIFVAWLITHRCNLRCKFCNYWQRPIIKEKELSVKEFSEASKKLAKLGVRVVNLGGGEPFMREDLPEIISELSKNHIVIINTNGTMVTEENAVKIFRAGTDIVNVSIDFFQKEKHDYYRGKGVYEKAVKSLEILKESRSKKSQKIAIQTILTSENMQELEELINLAREKGVDFTFNPYRPGDNHKADLKIRERFKVHQLYKLRKQYPNFKVTTFALKKTEEYVKNGFVPNCGAGKYMLAIDPYGEINPCEDRIHISIGNIRDLRITNIIIIGLEKIYSENTCNKCWTRERSEVEFLYTFGGWEWVKYLLYAMKW